jgi:hypothetical protein
MKKYLILADGFLYFRTDPSVEYRLMPDKSDATEYTLDEAIAIKTKFLNEGLLIEFIPVDSRKPLGIYIDPAPSDEQDFADYARHMMKNWTQMINCCWNFLDSDVAQEKLDRAIANLKTYIETEKQNKHYKSHTVIYVGFPLDLSDDTVQTFAPFFMLSVNYGANESCITNFLIK